MKFNCSESSQCTLKIKQLYLNVLHSYLILDKYFVSEYKINPFSGGRCNKMLNLKRSNLWTEASSCVNTMCLAII